MRKALFAAVLCLCIAGVHLADECTEFINNVNPPDFNPSEFSADVEMSRQEKGTVAKVRLVYSAKKQVVRMTVSESGVKRDTFFMANLGLGTILRFDYSQGRGSCKRVSFEAEKSKAMFFVGGTTEGKLQNALGFLRMTGLSGFGDNNIVLNTLPASQTKRDIPVTGYQSCQRLNSDDSQINLLVSHYFDRHNNPVTITVMGKGTVLGEKDVDFLHVYSFFNVQTTVDPLELETPDGVFCEGEGDSQFPALPTRISFASEVFDTTGILAQQDQTFDTVDRFAVMHESGETTFRDYISGLSFKVNDDVRSCTIQNITDADALPFDYTINGKVQEMTMKQFFYLGSNTFMHIGEKTIRGIPTDVYVGRVNLPDRKESGITVQWYFAKDTVQSWNDKIPEVSQNKLRIPMLFRKWDTDQTLRSVDINLLNVNFAPLLVGTIDLSPCLVGATANHVQVLVQGTRDDVAKANVEGFKRNALHDIAQAAQLQWWRLGFFQVYFEQSRVVIEFEILGKPPKASDVAEPPVYVTVQQALDNLRAAVNGDGGLQLKGYDPDKKTFSKQLTATLGVISV